MNQSTNPVHVNITYNVVQILGFSQSEETLSISGWFTMRWTDPRLTWNPEEFSEIQEVSLPTTNLWIPDVGVMNGKASTDFDFSAGVRGRVTVNNDGSVTWLHGAVLDVTCPLDVSFFPFDYQTCFLILVPWQSGEQQLLLQPFTHGSAVDNSYLPNSNVSEWEIQSVHFVRKKYRSDMNVTYQYVSIAIHLKRQPLYFIVLVLVPFSMLSALACLIFTLDDTGDRLSVALSLVLSMTMYVVIVSTNAPRSMRTLPVLGIFLLDQLGLLSIATILAVMNNKLYQSKELISWQDFIYAISGTGQGKRRGSEPYSDHLYINRHTHYNHNYNDRNKSSHCNINRQEPEYKLSLQQANQLLEKSTTQQQNYFKKYCRPVKLLSRKSSKTNNNSSGGKSKINSNRYFPIHHEGGHFMDYYDSEIILNATNFPSDGKFRPVDPDSDSPIVQVHKTARPTFITTTNPNIIHNINAFNNNNIDISNGSNSDKHDIIKHHDCKMNHSRIHDSGLLNKSCHLSKGKPKGSTSERSPWREHLPMSYTQIIKQKYPIKSTYKHSTPSETESSPSDGDEDDNINGDVEELNSDTSERIFQTTVTATAAAALAATRVIASSYGVRNQNLSRLKPYGIKPSLNTNKNTSLHTSGFCDATKSKRYAESALLINRDEEYDRINTKVAAQAAINAAFEAAAQTYQLSKENARHRSRCHFDYFPSSQCRKCHNQSLLNNISNNHQSDYSNELSPYPYRKLASRLDCIQMITYLFLSTINAIACLILMPKYSQDSNPPAHLIS
ncbi:Neuronal acetylcholine receptor subunit alpha-6 [Schistosoma japonicum]|nr:Neuronal acetylcholine receptor subunit alpha-6 [Schistosoma japonicum]